MVVGVAGVNGGFEGLDGVLITVDVNGSAIRDTGSWAAKTKVLLSMIFGPCVGGEGESRDMDVSI